MIIMYYTSNVCVYVCLCVCECDVAQSTKLQLIED